jgi:hypothetical protein
MGGDHDGAEGGKPPPAFCKKVPLPASPELEACKAAADACVAASTDDKSCCDAHHACVKAAFDAAAQTPVN